MKKIDENESFSFPMATNCAAGTVALRGIFIFTPIPLLFLLPIADCFFCAIITSIYGIGYTAVLKEYKKLTYGLELLLKTDCKSILRGYLI